jgi:hypothetical protein
VARLYHFDVARWEGEGGAPTDRQASRVGRGSHRKHGRGWRSLAGIISAAALVALLAYARRKARAEPRKTHQSDVVRSYS